MLGTDLCAELGGYYDVVGMDARRPAHVICDIRDKKAVAKSVTRARPDLIFHAAAWTDVDGCEENPEKTEEVNITGTENIALSAAQGNIPVIYMSTDFVFDGKKKSPYNEKDAPNPVNVYGKSKLEGEKKIASLKKSVILRASWLFGANGKNFVDTILEKAKKEKKIKVVDDQTGCPTYTKDTSRAIRALLGLENPWGAGGEIYHISNSGEVSWFDYAREILKMAGIKGVETIPTKSNELRRPAARPAFSALDNAKFEKATNFTMRPWRKALAEYINEK